MTCCGARRTGTGGSRSCRCCCSGASEAVLTPGDDAVLEADDELLFAGASSQRRELESTMVVDATAAYVLFDQRVPASWVWRKLSRKVTVERR